MRKGIFISVVGLGAVAAVGALCATARADERVALRNGFEMRCNHHAEVDGRVRLYQSTDEGSFIEFKPEEIGGFEWVADLPVAAPAEDEAGAVASVPSPIKDVKLSPADLHEILAKAGLDHNLDVDLLASLVKAESGGNARAVSRTGARGLMQLMPGTAAQLGVGNSFEAADNVRGGSTYLDALLVYYHENLSLALAAYNAGPGAVNKYHGIPPYRETRVYVARVIHEFNKRVRARQALAASVSGVRAGGSR